MEYELHKDYEYADLGQRSVMILESLGRSGGHCPCQIPQSDDTLCICKDFRSKLEDQNVPSGTLCICRLYKKK